MKKPTFLKNGILAFLLLYGLQFFAQNYEPFTPRFDQDLRGDIVLIGNNILGPDNNAFNENDVYNHRVDMTYIDIDGDPSTFSSSSADLQVPNPNCYRIVHAGLYWGAVTNGPEPITNVKLKGPSGGYNDVVGEVIYDANGTATGDSFPYSCYADVTDLVTSLDVELGTYTMANVSSAQGRTADFDPWNGTGYSAGWSLFVVYEDLTLPGKSITSFDGFSAISSSVNLDIPVSGFRTVPAPTPVRANFAFAALEGDKPIENDRMLLNGTPLSAADRDGNNFFNSSVTQLSATPVNDRNPNSTNTLGFDTGVMVVPNPSNSVIGNNTTSATVRLESDQDVYFQYFFALAVDIIEPKLFLTKIVEDEAGNNIGGELVGLGTVLNYVIGFQNRGNDDATEAQIRDILPTNIIFNYPEDIEYLPDGVTVRSYNEATREIIFDLDNEIVEQNDPVQEIRFKVQVVEECADLAEACSNIITNQAFASYKGTLNPNFLITDDPSFSENTGCLLTPSATNFLADLDCTYTEEVVLCGDSTTLTAADGYDSYSWSTNPGGNPVIGTGQSITVTNTGTYYSFNNAIAPCQSIEQEYVVSVFGGNTDNPVIPFADEVVTCPNDGKLLPNIFLCGDNDSRFIQTGITDSTSMIWEKLDESSCDAVANEDCANEDASCTWNEVETGPDYNADEAGQYRLTINYEGGCFNQFYFNVYENLLVPTVTSKDIACTTPGEIVVGGIPNGYEYSIDGSNYQSSNTFIVTTPGIYKVFIKQVGISSNPCIFETPEVQIRNQDFEGSAIIIQPYCYGEKGSVKLAALDSQPQYYYSIYSGGTLVNEVGPIDASDYTFPNLNTGTYTVNVSNEDGCTFSDQITIVEPPLLAATAALTTPLSCTDGEITVYPQGGTPPYFYFVNSETEFQSNPEITVTAPGTFNIKVVDSNNCEAETSITVEAIDGPVFTIESTDIACSDPTGSGTITINVSETNGNTLRYSIDNGANFVNSNVFTNLSAGDYQVVVRTVQGGPNSCESSPETVTISAQTGTTGEAEITSNYTCDSNAEITVTNVSGGVAPYTYSIDGSNFQSDPTFSDLTDGTYSVTIKDSGDCTSITSSITIEPLNPPIDMSFNNTEVGCPSNTSTVTITNVTGGVAPLEYQITAPSAAATEYQASNSFADLSPGTYTFQVRDANDCIYSESYTIDGLPTISIVGQVISDVNCFGASDGTIEFTVSGSSNFTYTINGGNSTNGTASINLSGLNAGDYTILITDSDSGCTATTTVTIDGASAPVSATAEVSPISCNTSGNATITATGGSGGYSYTLTMPDNSTLAAQASNIFTNLNQTGTYTVSISDSQNCTETINFSLDPADVPTVNLDSSSILCYDGTNGASIVANVSGGVAPYEYSLNGGAFSTENSFNDLIPGVYTIQVRDAAGCTASSNSETIADQLVFNTVLDKTLDCTASPDASITGTFSGGTAPYTYSVSINGGAFNPLGTTGSPFIYSTSNPGTYQFEITDSKGCSLQSNISEITTITPPDIISVVQTNPILCNGDANAAIEITINENVGTAPLVINVYNNTTNTDYGIQTSSLPAGSYTVTLTDANSCTDTENIVIDEPSPIIVNSRSVDITCSSTGESKGSVIVENVSGGTAPYNYFVTGTNNYSASELNNSGTTSTTFDVVDFGIYEINVVDANGCSVLTQDILVASPPNDLDISIDSAVDCSTGGEATVTITTAGASAGPFYFAIYEGPSTSYPSNGTWIGEDSVGSKSAQFSGLTPGITYTFIVYDDSTKCSYFETASAPIPTNSELVVDALVANNISCKGSADGTVSFTINSTYTIDTDVSYEVFNSLSLASTSVSGTATVPANGTFDIPNIGPLEFGNYFVLVEETSGPNAGCGVITVPFNITESAIDLELDAEITKNANCNPGSGIITAIASNGTAPYRYQISTTPAPPSSSDTIWSSNSIFNVDAGNYYIHALDAYGCIITVNLDLPSDPLPIVSATASNECTATEGTYEIEVTLSSLGVAPYSYSIDGGAYQNLGTSFTLDGLSSGDHTIEVRDANGCGNSVTVTIETSLDVFANTTALPSCIDDDGEVTIEGTGGSGSYTYSISPSPATVTLTGNVFSGLPSGDYDITITDSVTGCTAETNVSLTDATPVTFSSEVNDNFCNGDSNGTITVLLPDTNDNPIYTYEILAPITVAPQTSNIFTGLTAGTYSVRVTSGRNCSLTQDVIIDEPELLIATGSASEFACDADNTFTASTLTISANGGTAPYSYSIDGTNYLTSDSFQIIDNGSTQLLTIYAKDNNGCIATESVTLEPLPEITSAVVDVTNPIDCTNTGSVSITVTGGSGNYSYQLLPDGAPQSSNVFEITEPGDYYYQVNDEDTGCFFATDAFTVAPFDLMEVLADGISPIPCFGVAEGGIEFTVSGYNGAFEYEILDADGNSIIGINTSNTASNPTLVNTIPAGNYTVQVTQLESPFCSTNSNTITILAPSEELILDVSETSSVSCEDGQGTFTAIATGGWGGYEFELSGASNMPYSPNSTFSDLSAGNYTINVRDAEGCVVTENITLEIPTPINADIDATTTALACFGDTNATITATNVTGGQGEGYLYTLHRLAPIESFSGPQSSNSFTNLGAGTYEILVTDAISCEFNTPTITITEPSPLEVNLVKETSQTCTTGTTLTLSAAGGTAPYSYSESESFSTVLGTFNTSTTFGVGVGTFQYFVRDSNGCVATVSNEIIIDPLPDLEVVLDGTNATINCAGEETGVIVANAIGGLGNYIYTLQDASGNDLPDAVQDRPGVFTNLAAGTYSVNVESGDCLETSGNITIEEPSDPMLVDFKVNGVTCNGEDDGSIEIMATGGNGIIKYAISPQLDQFFDDPIFEDLSPGDYSVIVQDELGCYLTFDFSIDQPEPVIITIVADSLIPEVCDGDGGGEFSIDISGGNLPYSVSLDDYEGEYTTGSDTQTVFDFTDLGGGDHIVYVRDALGCESEWNITFPESVVLNPEVSVDYECADNALSNIVTVTVDESVEPKDLDYSLNGGPYQASNTFNNVPAGPNQYIDVRHTNGCIQRTPIFDMDSYVPVELVLKTGEVNEIIALASGGTGIYEYWLNGESQGDNNTMVISESGEFEVMVVDTNGCFAEARIRMDFVDICIPNYFTPNGDGVQDEWAPGCSQQYENLVFKIFDRYGRMVAKLNQGEKWDGKYGGNELPTGDYWYVVDLNFGNNDREFVGHFTLYR